MEPVDEGHGSVGTKGVGRGILTTENEQNMVERKTEAEMKKSPVHPCCDGDTSHRQVCVIVTRLITSELHITEMSYEFL